MTAPEDFDVRFLRATGASTIINSLMAQLLTEKPEDPVQWTINTLRAKRLHFSSDDVLMLLDAASSESTTPSPNTDNNALPSTNDEEQQHAPPPPPVPTPSGNFNYLSLNVFLETLFDLDQAQHFGNFPMIPADPLTNISSGRHALFSTADDRFHSVGSKDYGGFGKDVDNMENVAETLVDVVKNEFAKVSSLSDASRKDETTAGSKSEAVHQDASNDVSHDDDEIAHVHQQIQLLNDRVAEIANGTQAASSTKKVLIPPYVRAVMDVAAGRLKLEAIAKRNKRVLLTRMAEAGKSDDNDDEAAPAPSGKKGKKDAAKTTTPPPEPQDGSPDGDGDGSAADTAQLEASPFSLHIVVPLRLASDFHDHYTTIDHRIRWALKTSYPDTNVQYYVGEESYQEVCKSRCGTDDLDGGRWSPAARFPASSVRAVVRTISRSGLQGSIHTFADDASTGTSGFFTAIANAAKFPDPPTTDKRLVLVLDTLEPIVHLGGLGNFIFPLLLSEPLPEGATAQVALPPPGHLAQGSVAISSNASPQSTISQTSPGAQESTTKGAAKKQDKQKEQLAAAAAQNAAQAAASMNSSSASAFAVVVTSNEQDKPPSVHSLGAAAVMHKLLSPWLRNAKANVALPVSSLLGVPAIAFDAAALQPPAASDDDSAVSPLSIPSLYFTRHYHPAFLLELATIVAERAAPSTQPSSSNLATTSAVHTMPLRPLVQDPFVHSGSFTTVAHTVLNACAPAVAEKDRTAAQRDSEALAKAIVSADDNKLKNKFEALCANTALVNMAPSPGTSNSAEWLEHGGGSFASAMEKLSTLVTPALFA